MSIKKNRELMVEQIKRLRGELNEVGKSELYKVGETIKLKKGIGYWDVTQYPYGGDFQRLSKETIATVVDGMVKYPNREVRATITVNGKTRTIVVSSIGIKESVNEALSAGTKVRNKRPTRRSGSVGTIVRYDKRSDNYVVDIGKYQSVFWSAEDTEVIDDVVDSIISEPVGIAENILAIRNQ